MDPIDVPPHPATAVLAAELHAAGWVAADERWEALDHEVRHQVLAHVTARPGLLERLSPKIRDAANRIVLFEVWQELSVQFKPAAHVEHRLEVCERLLQERHRLLLHFDPAGDGRAVVATGDIASATVIGVLVPGVGNDLTTVLHLMERTDRLREGAGVDVAMIAWLGYDTPKGPHNPLAVLAEATTARMARVGAGELHTFLHGLAGGNPAAEIVIIAHSYGTLVTGLAAADGLPVDRIVLLGSPGVGIAHVAQMRLRERAAVYAGAHGDDPIARIGELQERIHHMGADPLDPEFGAIVLDLGPDGGHEYFAPDQHSLAVVRRIVTGAWPE